MQRVLEFGHVAEDLALAGQAFAHDRRLLSSLLRGVSMQSYEMHCRSCAKACRRGQIFGDMAELEHALHSKCHPPPHQDQVPVGRASTNRQDHQALDRNHPGRVMLGTLRRRTRRSRTTSSNKLMTKREISA